MIKTHGPQTPPEVISGLRTVTYHHVTISWTNGRNVGFLSCILMWSADPLGIWSHISKVKPSPPTRLFPSPTGFEVHSPLAEKSQGQVTSKIYSGILKIGLHSALHAKLFLDFSLTNKDFVNHIFSPKHFLKRSMIIILKHWY